MVDKRLTYLTVLIALVGFLEQLTTPVWFGDLTGKIYVLAIALAFCRPSSVRIFLFLIAAGAVHIFYRMPYVLNHFFFEFLIYCNCLIVYAVLCIKGRTWKISAQELYISIIPLIRLYVLGLYAFAFCAKLNSDFLDPQVSCAAVLMASIQKAHAFMPQAEWLRIASIWTTLALEGLMPALLFFSKTRQAAIVAGILFHCVLAFIPSTIFLTFSASMMAWYFVFLSDGAFELVVELGNRLSRFLNTHVPRRTIRFACIFAFVFGLLVWNDLNGRDFLRWAGLGVSIDVAVAALYLYVIFKARKQSAAAIRFVPKPLGLVVLLLPLVLNGIAPYLGIKTETSMVMYSNLRTLGPQPNHLIIPPSAVIFKQELVKVLESDVKGLQEFANGPYWLTVFEFRRITSQIKRSFFVRVLYRGKELAIFRDPYGTSSNPLFKPVPWWARKFILFQPVDASAHCHCLW